MSTTHLPTHPSSSKKRKSSSPDSPSSTSSTSSRKDDSLRTSKGEDQDVINFRPLNKRPKFQFEPSKLSQSLPGFLEQMRRGNESLEAGDAKGFEILDGEEIQEDGNESEGGDEEGSEDSDTESDAKRQPPYIEMELGLGVLEEKGRRASDLESDSSSVSQDSGDESDASKQTRERESGSVGEAETSSESESSSEESEEDHR